jgi:hypothetical protein
MGDKNSDGRGLEEIIAQQTRLMERIAALEKPHEKDVWDKLGTLTGVIVAIVGGLFSFLYSHYQSKQDDTNKQHLAKMQEIQAVGTFMPYLVGKDPDAKVIALFELGGTLGKPAAIIAAKGLNSALAASNDGKLDTSAVTYLQDVASTGNSQDQKLAANVLRDIVPQLCSQPKFPSTDQSPFDQTACQLGGNGGAETAQSEAKNNFCASGPDDNPTSPIVTTIGDFTLLQDQVRQIPHINFGNYRQHPFTSEPGPVQDRTPLRDLGEGKLVQLQGYVKIARQEGAEGVNCGANVPNDPAYHDIHISIVGNAGDAECSGVVVEMSPRHRPPAWTAQLVNEVAASKLLVRITGQRMFDSSHTACVNGSPVIGDPSRISLWEIHPIYRFEVCPTENCTDGGWTPLEKWKKT